MHDTEHKGLSFCSDEEYNALQSKNTPSYLSPDPLSLPVMRS